VSKRRGGPPLLPFSSAKVRAIVDAALEEDIGRRDLTTEIVLAPGQWAAGRVVAQSTFIVAGVALVGMVCRRLDGAVAVEELAEDGEEVSAGREIVRLRGPASALLAGERTALNFVQRLSGIATLTRRFVRAVEGTGVAITDTRKTTPGMRLLEKYATAVGGAVNHRLGLDDGILIKDNHILLAGGVRAAVERAREAAPWGMRVEVECSDEAQVEEALAAGAHAILLDNVTPTRAQELVALVGKRAEVEISGGVSLENVAQYAAAKPQRISVGALTHSAPAVPIHMVVERADGRAG